MFTRLRRATRIAGFRRWLDIGYAVRKGETAVRIGAPCRPSKKALTRWRTEESNPDSKPRTYFRLVPVSLAWRLKRIQDPLRTCKFTKESAARRDGR